MPSHIQTKTCLWCGGQWQSRSIKARTCSPKCRAQLREQEHGPTRTAHPKVYPDHVVNRVAELYSAGMTVREVQEAMGKGVKVQNVILRHEIGTRPAVKRDQHGENNSSWKGDSATYGALHLRVAALRGKPQKCSACDTEDPNLRYDWANLSGDYCNVNDFVRLCTRCHAALDRRLRDRLKGSLSAHVRKAGDANVS